jgi:LacI family transcriptional regulator
VSRVLNGNYPVATGTRQRVLDAVRTLNYVVNAHARALAVNTSDVLGVLVNNVSDPFFALMAGAVQREAAREDLLAMIGNTGGSPVEELRYIRLLLRQRVRAIVLTGGHRDDADYLAELAELVRHAVASDTRVVFCGRPPVAGCPAITLDFDNRRGAQALTRYVLTVGHRRIGYITGPAGHSTTHARLHGHTDALAERGFSVDEDLVVSGTFDREAGWEAATRLLSAPEPPTAIIAANDTVALGVLAAAREAGIAVPAGLSVAGFDDLPFSMDAYPALTTVRLPLVAAGQRAGRIALGEEPLAPGTVATVRTELIVRDSVSGPGER